jgi:hypothetical protein
MVGSGEEGSSSFLKKKNQKTFGYWTGASRKARLKE